MFDWLHRLVSSHWAILVGVCRDYTSIVDIRIIDLGFSGPFGLFPPVMCGAVTMILSLRKWSFGMHDNRLGGQEF